VLACAGDVPPSKFAGLVALAETRASIKVRVVNVVDLMT